MGGIHDSVSLQHLTQTTGTTESTPTPDTSGFGVKASTPDTPRGAQAEHITAMGSRLEDRQIGMGSLISKEGLSAILDRSEGSSVKSTLLGLLFKVSPSLVQVGERTDRSAMELADKYQGLVKNGGTAEQKIETLRALKGQLEAVGSRTPGGSDVIKNMIGFVDQEIHTLATHGNLAQEVREFDMGSLNRVEPRSKPQTQQEEIRGFDRSQLKRVETHEKDSVKLQAEIRGFDKSQLKGIPLGPKTPTHEEQIRSFDQSTLKGIPQGPKAPTIGDQIHSFEKSTLKHVDTKQLPADLKGLQVAAELEALWDKNPTAALLIGRAIQQDPRLAPFAAAADSDGSLGRVADKFVAYAKIDKAGADKLLATALKELGEGHSLDAIKGQLDKELVKASMTSDFNIGMAQSKSGLQDWSVSWNTKTADNLSSILIDGAGRVDTALIAEIRTQLSSDANRAGNPRGPHADHLKGMLDKLENSASLRDAIQSVGVPNNQSGTAATMIRSALGLPEGMPLGEAETRRVVLSAVLGELRQGDVGSCFATSVAIRVQNHQPERLVSDLKQMIETGALTRPKGTGTAEVPVSGRMSGKDLQKEITLDGSGKLTQVSGRAVSPAVELSTIPGLSSAMKSLGIPEDQIAARLKEAATAAGSPTTAEGILKQVVMKEVGISSEMLDARAEVQTLGKEVRGIVSDISRLNTELTALKNATFPSEVAITNKQKEITAREGDLNTKIDQYSRKHDQAMGKVDIGPNRDPRAIGRFDEKMAVCSNAFLAQSDNRLLRSWEYTLTAFAEQGLAHNHKKDVISSLFGSATRPGEGTFSFGTSLPGLDTKLGELFSGFGLESFSLRRNFKANLEEILSNRLQVQYDANRGLGALSADGNSSRGTFTFYDNTGVTDPALWHPADSQDAFARMISGMILEAGAKTLEKMGIENPKFSESVDKLAQFAHSSDFTEASVRNLAKSFNKKLPDNLTDFSKAELTPWAMRVGNSESSVLANYHALGVEKPKGVESKFGFTTSGLAGWMIGQLQTMHKDIHTQVDASPRTYSVPLSNSPHAFLLMPGHPDLRSAWEPGVKADEWIKSKLTTPGEEMSKKRLGAPDLTTMHDKLSPAMQAEFLKSIAGLKKDNYAITPRGIYLQMADQLASNPKKETMLKTLNQVMVNSLGAPSVTFADSNWGGGSSHTFFNFTYNIGTESLEMWAKPTNGDSYALDQNKWVSSWWNMTTNPKSFGEA